MGTILAVSATLLICSIPTSSYAHVSLHAMEQGRQPTIEEAMKSEVDEFGIPKDLYLLDPTLLQYKKKIEKRRRFNRQHGNQIIGLSATSAVLGFLIAGLSVGDEDEYYYNAGWLISGTGLGLSIYGLFIRDRPVSTAKLQNYYRAKYLSTP